MPFALVKIVFSILMLCYTFLALPLKAQNDIYVDKNGVMRWERDSVALTGFGVNYTLPFAHAYRAADSLGVKHEDAIDEDVYHFARLGLDLYRIHVWDTEISDTLGNLLDNEHLRLLDYTVAAMKRRGMKIVMTPIAYWGGGWPEPDTPTPGFSGKYGKDASLTHPEAIKAQERYLNQFLEHVNTYTGSAYKYDPDVLAFEISNEPKHDEPIEDVTDFIDRMVSAMRETGTGKPIFYNMSHSIHLVEGYFNADIQGGTFQWYPTNLLAGHELKGNYLPNVDQYSIPFEDDERFKSMAKIIYEFDPADIGASYMYPAMARSFRTAGMQLAAQFSYDAAFMAPYNTEYGTHYMNLPYAPEKALSLKIAAEAFRNVPHYEDYGIYPDNTQFGDFRVDYESDLAEMVTATKFYYTNNTEAQPSTPDQLESIAGFGNSTVVNYEGRGAYFLDKIETGIWRLEVMPDAIWVRDPFEKISFKNKVAVLNWRQWEMQLNLPDLGENYIIEAINDGNAHTTALENGSFSVKPGTYLLKSENNAAKLQPNSEWETMVLNEFFAPETSLETTVVQHDAPRAITKGRKLEVKADVFTKEEANDVYLQVLHVGRSGRLPMKRTSGYTYEVMIPDTLVHEGFLEYHIVVKAGGKQQTFPKGNEGQPGDWDFYDESPYKVRVLPENEPLYLFSAHEDASKLIWQWQPGVTAGAFATAQPGRDEFRVALDSIPKQGTDELRHYAMRYYFGENIAGRQHELHSKTKLILHGRSDDQEGLPVEIALIMKNGTAFGGTVMVTRGADDYEISIDALTQVKLVNLPRPYPDFLPYYFEGKTQSFSIDQIEMLQIGIGAEIAEDELDALHFMAIESIRLE